MPTNNAPPSPAALKPSGTAANPAFVTTASPTFDASSVLDPDVFAGVRDRVQYQFLRGVRRTLSWWSWLSVLHGGEGDARVDMHPTTT